MARPSSDQIHSPSSPGALVPNAVVVGFALLGYATVVGACGGSSSSSDSRTFVDSTTASTVSTVARPPPSAGTTGHTAPLSVGTASTPRSSVAPSGPTAASELSVEQQAAAYELVIRGRVYAQRERSPSRHPRRVARRSPNRRRWTSAAVDTSNGHRRTVRRRFDREHLETARRRPDAGDSWIDARGAWSRLSPNSAADTAPWGAGRRVADH